MRKTKGRILWAAIVLAAMISPVGAQQIHGRVRETWTRVSTDPGDEPLDSMVQDYQLNFRNMIARNLSWQVRLRTLLRGTDQDIVPTDSDTALFEPFLQVVYEGRQWQVSGGARMTRLTPKGSHSNAMQRERRDYFGRVRWSDEIADSKTLDVDWSLFRLEREEDHVNLSADNRSLLTVGFSANRGSATVGMENRAYDDLVTGFERDLVEFTGSGDFRHTFQRAKLTVSGRGLISEQKREEFLPGARPLTTRVQRNPRVGLFGVDTTPLMDQLTDTPQLIDGDENAAAADLDGLFRNYGADLGFPKKVAIIHLYVDKQLQAGNEQDYAFEVYVSDDGDIWTRADNVSSLFPSCSALFPSTGVPPQQGYCFEPLQNRFEMRFSEQESRFIKIVNTDFSAAEVPLRVTEIRLFGEETRNPGTIDFGASRQSGNLAMVWRPAEPVNVNFYVTGSRLANDSPTSKEEDEDNTSTLTTVYRSPRKVTATGRLQAANRDSTTGRSERDRIVSFTVAGSPVPDVDLSASAARRRNRSPGAGVISANDTLNLRSAFRIAVHTQASFDLSFARLDNREIDRIQNRRTGRFSMVTMLRPSLQLTNDWTMARVEFDGALPIESRTDFDLRSRISYRPTRVLGGSFEYLYQDVAGRKGASQLLDLDWLPFPGGALQLQFTLVRDRLGDRGALLDEERVGMRWTLNPRTLLEATYGLVRRGDASGDTTARTIAAVLEFRF